MLVDTGHHPQGTNIEQIVAVLLAEGLLGGFHFNNRKYADDDLIVGSIDPFELFRIMREIARAPRRGRDVAFMIDQSHNVEGKIDAMIQSVMNIQTAYAKALLVDEAAARGGAARGRRARRRTGSCSRRSRPTCARCSRGCASSSASRPIPVAAFRDGGLRERLARERGTASRRERVRAAVTRRWHRCASPSSSPASATRCSPRPGARRCEVLERLGHEVVFPAEQTCCGQMHLNSGYRDEARRLARRFVEIFGGYEAVVSPSSSCVGTVRELPTARRIADERVFELSELLVQRLGVDDVGASFPDRVTYHPTCHSLRVTRVGDAPLRLLRNVRGLELVELPRADECCGFGGTFAIKNADTSSAMLADKCAAIEATGARGLHRASTARACCRSAAASRAAARRFAPIHLAEILASTMTRRFPDAARVELANVAAADEPPQRDRHDPREARAASSAELPDWEELREAGRAIKADVLARLDELPARSSRRRCRRPAATSTGRATPPRRTRSSSRSRARTASTRS